MILGYKQKGSWSVAKITAEHISLAKKNLDVNVPEISDTSET